MSMPAKTDFQRIAISMIGALILAAASVASVATAADQAAASVVAPAAPSALPIR